MNTIELFGIMWVIEGNRSLCNLIGGGGSVRIHNYLRQVTIAPRNPNDVSWLVFFDEIQLRDIKVIWGLIDERGD